MTTRPRASGSRTVTIAGATGMVGRHLVEALLARGDRVIALVRQPSVQHFPSAVEVRGWQASDLVAPVDGADAGDHERLAVAADAHVEVGGHRLAARPVADAQSPHLRRLPLA